MVTPVYDRDGNAATFSADERADIVAIWRAVAEDYAAFDVDVRGRAGWLGWLGCLGCLPACLAGWLAAARPAGRPAAARRRAGSLLARGCWAAARPQPRAAATSGRR